MTSSYIETDKSDILSVPDKRKKISILNESSRNYKPKRSKSRTIQVRNDESHAHSNELDKFINYVNTSVKWADTNNSDSDAIKRNNNYLFFLAKVGIKNINNAKNMEKNM